MHRLNALVDVSDSYTSFSVDESRRLQELSTVPPCKWMRLEHPKYPWKILVTADVPSPGALAGVTIGRVLSAIAEDLQKEVSQVEAHSVRGMRNAIERHQSSLTPDYYGGAAYAPLKRLHWLGTRSIRVLGLSAHAVEADVFTMHFAHDLLPEKPLPAIPSLPESHPAYDPPEYPWHESLATYIQMTRAGGHTIHKGIRQNGDRTRNNRSRKHRTRIAQVCDERIRPPTYHSTENTPEPDFNFVGDGTLLY
jgi:hypothetical protein